MPKLASPSRSREKLLCMEFVSSAKNRGPRSLATSGSQADLSVKPWCFNKVHLIGGSNHGTSKQTVVSQADWLVDGYDQ